MGKFETILSFIFQVLFILIGLMLQWKIGDEHIYFGVFVAAIFIIFGTVASIYYRNDVREKEDALHAVSETEDSDDKE